MKLLSLHCDYIIFKPVKKALKEPEELDEKRKKGESVEEALVILTAVESSDTFEIVEEYVANIQGIASQVKAQRIVLYPYAHLSSDLGKPSVALKILEKAHSLLEKKGFEVHRAPFGYYKEFELKCKGHPLAELSRSIGKSVVVKKKPAKASKIILDRRNLSEFDHRILGEKLKLFTFSEEVGAGLPLWLPYGEMLRHVLMEFMREIEEKHGYRYVSVPMITRGALYEKTGHLPYYKDTMYSPMDIEGEDYYLKPMNCPHHHMIFKELVKSYRDLPLRLAEAGATYRNELSGVTYGLIRVRGFTQNDSHIYVTEDQLKEEFLKVLALFKEVYTVFGIQGYWFRLSLPDFEKNPEKYTGDIKTWEKASRVIREAMKEFGAAFVEGKGEATFYGPKIDVQIKNVQGKEETIATSQVDLIVPEKLGLAYVDKDDKKKHVIVIHRAILGSYERFIAYLLEQTKGNLPLWLAPVQVRLLSFTERNVEAARKVFEQLQEKGFRVEMDERNLSVDAKVREGELMKIPYLVVVGDKEEKAETVAVRRRGEKKVAFGVKTEDFVSQARKEIAEKR